MRVRIDRPGDLNGRIVGEGTELDLPEGKDPAPGWMTPLDDEAKEACAKIQEANDAKLRGVKIESLTKQITFLQAQLDLELLKREPKSASRRARKVKSAEDEDAL